MTVAELIEELKKMPQDARVFHVWDGKPRTAITFVWLSRSGNVMTADYNQNVYTNEHRPADAPSDDRYWKMPDGFNPLDEI